MAWVHAVIETPSQQHGAASDFWERALGWRLGPPWAEHAELRSFVPARGTPYVHLQQVTGPARAHLDLEVDDLDATARRALELGAHRVAVHDTWQTLRSPGGLPFCVVPTGARELPEPVTWREGHRSRMVQVCIDSPASVHEAEVDFWRALLPGTVTPTDSPEFAGKWHDDDDGSPVQLLFQRLDEHAGTVRAHLDLGTDDRAAEVARLVGCGADDIAPGNGWHVLRDPTGRYFCVTDNSPASTVRRQRD